MKMIVKYMETELTCDEQSFWIKKYKELPFREKHVKQSNFD